MTLIVNPRPDTVRKNQPLSLQSPLRQLRGVGERSAENLARLGLHYVGDLLFHLPLRYQDRSRIVALRDLRVGDEVLIEGEVLSSELRYARRRMLMVTIGDGTGLLLLRFFHFSERQREGLGRGQWLRIYGEVRSFSGGGLEMVHPEYQAVERQGMPLPAQGLTPVYPLAVGVHQLQLHKLMDQALAVFGSDPSPAQAIEWLDEDERHEAGLMALDEALRTVHRPPADVSLALLRERRHPAQRRLAFEELLVQQLSFRQMRERIRSQAAPVCRGNGRLQRRLHDGLNFTLTAAQHRVIDEIATDLGGRNPMQRLIQGDVGSGKTIVAAMAVVQVVESGFQAAVMAPTELLAEQHYRAFSSWLQPLGIELAWLSGRLKAKGCGGETLPFQGVRITGGPIQMVDRTGLAERQVKGP